MKEEKELRVSKIENGTVIDHIPPGKGWAVLRILEIPAQTDAIVSILMNASSGKYGKKDIIKVEKRELTEEEVNKIALAAPNASINIIRDYSVVKKTRVELPDIIEGIIKCSNPACITNSSEPVKPKFRVINKSPATLRCLYCERITREEEILDQF